MNLPDPNITSFVMTRVTRMTSIRFLFPKNKTKVIIKLTDFTNVHGLLLSDPIPVIQDVHSNN